MNYIHYNLTLNSDVAMNSLTPSIVLFWTIECKGSYITLTLIFHLKAMKWDYLHIIYLCSLFFSVFLNMSSTQAMIFFIHIYLNIFYLNHFKMLEQNSTNLKLWYLYFLDFLSLENVKLSQIMWWNPSQRDTVIASVYPTLCLR